MAAGTIKAIWIIHTNPVVSMPDADAVAAALRACPFAVVSDITAQTDAAQLAQVMLPATGWAEKDGTVTNSDRTISRHRAVLPPPGQSRADWWILAQVTARIGWATGFDWQSEAQIFAKHAALCGIAGSLGGDFDISDHAAITDVGYASLAPSYGRKTRASAAGGFLAPGSFIRDGRARMWPIVPRAPQPLSPDLPFRLNTVRIRDQGHTMNRSAKSPRLSQYLAEPFVEMHPVGAARLGIRPADLVKLTNLHGHAILRALITDAAAPGQLFAPKHWINQNAAAARIDTLVPGVVDPISGQPESKAAAVAACKFKAA